MNKLRDLLNQKVIDSPELWFESVCNLLFFRTVLHIEHKQHVRYKITEAELYLNSKEHADVFAHGSDDQKKAGLFYFHKRGKSYQEGNIKGIDITFGNESRFGGILLRGLQNLDDEADYIDGPGRLSQRVVDIFERKKVIDVAPNLDIDIFNAQDLWLEEISGDDQVIYKAPRKGLTLSKDVEDRLPYFAKLYRYLAAPLKTRQGLELLSVALKNQGHDPVSLLGIRETTLDKRMALFQAGVELDPEGSYKKKNQIFYIQVLGELSRNN